MGNLVCNDYTLLGRSVRDHSFEFMGIGWIVAPIPNLAATPEASAVPGDKWPQFGPFNSEGIRAIAGMATSKTGRWDQAKEYKNTMNQAIGGITGRDYPAIRKSIANLDITWTYILRNHRGMLPAFDQNYWNAKTAVAWVQSGVVYLKLLTDLLAGYQQGINYQDATSLDAVATMLAAELPAVTASNLIYAATRVQPD